MSRLHHHTHRSSTNITGRTCSSNLALARTTKLRPTFSPLVRGCIATYNLTRMGRHLPLPRTISKGQCHIIKCTGCSSKCPFTRNTAVSLYPDFESVSTGLCMPRSFHVASFLPSILYVLITASIICPLSLTSFFSLLSTRLSWCTISLCFNVVLFSSSIKHINPLRVTFHIIVSFTLRATRSLIHSLSVQLPFVRRPTDIHPRSPIVSCHLPPSLSVVPCACAVHVVDCCDTTPGRLSHLLHIPYFPCLCIPSCTQSN